ncbi:MAG TPA: alpha/beta fold hydrolase, partial [Bacteroidales bacterium]
QSALDQFWSYRWNMQMMAAKGYVVFAPNRRGVSGFGQEWKEQISGDYGGKNMQDYLDATDAMAKESYIDAKRMGAVGASYGGYSVFYLAGVHQGRFKAFISHCGVFNFESEYGSTEELWFPDKDYGGPYWKNLPSYKYSPHLLVNNWDTPILIITGANDFRIPYTQSLEAFQAAQLHGVPSRLLYFEDAYHWVTKPQDAVVWQREFFEWLDKYLK